MAQYSLRMIEPWLIAHDECPWRHSKSFKQEGIRSFPPPSPSCLADHASTPPSPESLWTDFEPSPLTYQLSSPIFQLRCAIMVAGRSRRAVHRCCLQLVRWHSHNLASKILFSARSLVSSSAALVACSLGTHEQGHSSPRLHSPQKGPP